MTSFRPATISASSPPPCLCRCGVLCSGDNNGFLGGGDRASADIAASSFPKVPKKAKRSPRLRRRAWPRGAAL